jgi:hypothetical protein
VGLRYLAFAVANSCQWTQWQRTRTYKSSTMGERRGVYPLRYPRLKPENLSIHGELAVSAMVKRSGFFTSDQPKPSGRQGRRGFSVLMRRVSTILHSEVGEALGDQRCSDGFVLLISLPVPRYRLLSSNPLMASRAFRAMSWHPEGTCGRSGRLWRGRFVRESSCWEGAP